VPTLLSAGANATTVYMQSTKIQDVYLWYYHISDDDLGYFDLVIKIYRSVPDGQGDGAEGKKHHSQGGKMSQYLGMEHRA
jgi:hypothetical protein